MAGIISPIPFLTSFTEVDFQKGSLLLVNKPKEWTSFDVVHKIRNLIRRKYGLKKIKVGHSGTLDPLATGLLIICTGGWTKSLHQLQNLDKKYIAEITLGTETNTYDGEGKIVFQKEVPELSMTEIEDIVSTFTGSYEQVPPVFSAIKKDGQASYALARAGKEVIPEPRSVHVHEIKILDFNGGKLKLMVHCASGFYVRSLAHDIGESIGCGGYLSDLSRTMIGPYNLNDAFEMDAITEALQ